MSNTTPPPGFPPPLPPEPPTPAKKNRTNLVIISAATAVIAAIVGSGIVVVNSQDDGKPSSTTAAAPSTDTAATTKSAAPTYAAVDENSFTITLKTKSRQCFGSAGCNMTVEPDLSYLGDSGSVDPDAVYEITYEIHGDQSGPIIETAELTDRTSLRFTPTVISTASAGTKVSVEITDVSTQGS